MHANCKCLNIIWHWWWKVGVVCSVIWAVPLKGLWLSLIGLVYVNLQSLEKGALVQLKYPSQRFRYFCSGMREYGVIGVCFCVLGFCCIIMGWELVSENLPICYHIKKIILQLVITLSIYYESQTFLRLQLTVQASILILYILDNL